MTRTRVGNCEVDLSKVVSVTEKHERLPRRQVFGEHSSYSVDPVATSLQFTFKDGTSVIADGVSYEDYDRAVNPNKYASADRIEWRRYELIEQENMRLQKIHLQKTFWGQTI